MSLMPQVTALASPVCLTHQLAFLSSQGYIGLLLHVDYEFVVRIHLSVSGTVPQCVIPPTTDGGMTVQNSIESRSQTLTLMLVYMI